MCPRIAGRFLCAAEYNTEFYVHSLSVVECAPELRVDSLCAAEYKTEFHVHSLRVKCALEHRAHCLSLLLHVGNSDIQLFKCLYIGA